MNYWDSSALIEATLDATIKGRLVREGGYTRAHALAEMFAALSGGNLLIRVSANEAARTVRAAARYLQFVNLSEEDLLVALDNAQARGVRGGRVHDYLHALAAAKAKADTLLTTDENDF